jgi:alpha-tubulin suppressor-like RCC1 family protein
LSSTPITNLDDTLFKVQQFSYNGTFGCGVKADGTVWCWGSNTYGALGIGDTTVSSSTPPVQVVTAQGGPGLTGATSVGVSDTGYTACAITGATGTVYCWGYGGYGQLGNGYKNNSSFATPVYVDASMTQFSGAKTISVAYEHACTYNSDMTVWCWGDNSYGQIGNGSTATSVLYPAQVTNLQTLALNVVAADQPYGNSCAATSDGSAYCWGGNNYDALGNGLMSGMSIVPSQVLTAAGTPLANVTRVINWMSGYKLCAQKSDLSVWCWGGGSTTGVYATPLVDGQSNPVTGETVIGRECYLDANDKLWYSSYQSSNQVTCP